MYVELILQTNLFVYLFLNIEHVINVLLQVDIKLADFVVLFLVSRVLNIICSGKFYLKWIETVVVGFSSIHIVVFDLSFFNKLLDDEEMDVFVENVGKMKLSEIRLVHAIWH